MQTECMQYDTHKVVNTKVLLRKAITWFCPMTREQFHGNSDKVCDSMICSLALLDRSV